MNFENVRHDLSPDTHEVTNRAIRLSPWIFAIFKSTDARHYIIRARASTAQNRYSRREKNENSQLRDARKTPVYGNEPLCPGDDEETLRRDSSTGCNFPVPRRRTRAAISSEFTTESRGPSSSMGIYPTFPSCGGYNQPIDATTSTDTFRNFHTEFWPRTCDRLAESLLAARTRRDRKERSIGAHTRVFQIPRMFRTASLSLSVSANYGYSVGQSGSFSPVDETRAKWTSLATDSRLLSSTLMRL